MIHTLFNTDILTLPVDALVCPTSSIGPTKKALDLGFDEVYPQIREAVNQANNANDYRPGQLMCLQAGNAATDRLLITIPMTPHPMEPLSVTYFRKAMRSLRILLQQMEAKALAIPVTAFLDGADKPDMMRQSLVREMIQMDNVFEDLGRDLTIHLVHDGDD